MKEKLTFVKRYFAINTAWLAALGNSVYHVGMESRSQQLKIFTQLGETLTRLRDYRQVPSLTKLAEKMGEVDPYQYAKNRLQKYEKGTVIPPIAELDRILVALEIDGEMFVAALRAVREGVPLSLAFAELRVERKTSEKGEDEQGEDEMSLHERLDRIEAKLGLDQ